ncbi:related to 5`-nucleotidase precursor [Ustilago hordei]|uniref:Related to 5`-nucleotidase n=1 Tax=Ustilago hordei TaxID=120017 RepID=I2G385_USTHO|nr:related to 5`-nucleotidase precursor [Ustilago hordei]CCF53628.1 related to 5`-nucleotidase precursor [Ustilago hordei]SYW78957.1 related to 5`-nucleotidase precursor [Ustilago hordei]
MPITIPIIHFNDIYRVRQKDKKTGGTIGADQFAAKIQSIRQSWGELSNLSNLPPPPSSSSNLGTSRDWSAHSNSRERKGLVLFSGDLYSPSVESSVTRGTHLVPVINAMNLDCACLGNHDWDFGYPHLQTLMAQNNFPWLFSNVVDTNPRKEGGGDWDEHLQQDDRQVDGTLRSWTTTVQDVKVGCIGIVEKEWIATVPSFPQEFMYRNMLKTALKLSQVLRDPKGQACELVIAITHSRLPNDIDFANAIGAVAGADPTKHGVDLVLGGHDHIYYVGNGAASYTGDEFPRGEPGTEKDTNAMVVKSGTDFRDLSELKLELSEPNNNAIRTRTIKSLSVKRYRASPDDPTSPELKSMLDDLLAKISKSTSQSVAYTLTPWDVRSEKVRTDESAFGNFVADVLMNSYEEVLRERDNRGELSERRPADAREVDCCIICGGSLRGDQMYGPGKIALSDVLEILPFEDAVVCKELKGQDIWDALENGLSMYPKQEGRFPQVAGLLVKWDSRKEPGKRLISVELLDNPLDSTPSQNQQRTEKEGEEMDVDVPNTAGEGEVGKLRRFSVTKVPGGGYDVEVHRPALVSRGPLEMEKTYRVVTREYLAEGYDGFEALKRGEFVVDHENGQLMSAIVRKFLLGASYLWRMKQIRPLQAEGQDGDASTAAASVEMKQEEEGSEKGAEVNTLSKRTRIAITRARSLNLLKRAMKHNAVDTPVTELPSTPVKRASPGRSDSLGLTSEENMWRMVVDQSPGGFRDALHVGGSEHHSKFDSVSKRFNEPLTSGSGAGLATSSHAATRSFDADASRGDVDMGVPAAKRARTRRGGDEREQQLKIDNALFDPSLVSGLSTQIKDLLTLVTKAADPDGRLYVQPSGNGEPNASATAAEEEEEVGGGGANIALGSMAVDEGDDDATLAFLTAGGSGSGANGGAMRKGTPTQLSQDIVKKASELRATFKKLEEAAKSLPGGMDLGLKEQERLLTALEGFIARQDEALDKLAASPSGQNGHKKRREREGGEFGGKAGEIASSSFKHGAVASSSFHLNQEEMEQLRKDIKASTTTTASEDAGVDGEREKNGASVGNGNQDGSGKEEEGGDGDDTSNLAFVSPLVDGRLVDVARQQAQIPALTAIS